MASPQTLREALLREPSTLVPSAGHAAVAAVFTADLHLLLLRRAEHPKDPWSGHLGFPGGRVERDEDPLAAALRETWEEVGLRLGEEHLLGRLDDLAAVGGRPGMVIRPFVFLLPGPMPALEPNPAEVAATHLVPLPRLLEDAGRTTMPWRVGVQSVTLPAVDLAVEGQERPARLWGLTLRMVDDLLDRLDGRGHGIQRLRGAADRG